MSNTAGEVSSVSLETGVQAAPGKTKKPAHKVPFSHQKLASGVLTKGTVEEFQFARVSGYSKVLGQDIPKKDGSRVPNSGKASAYNVIGEAARAGEEFQQNVLHMLKPEPLFGVKPENLQDWLKEMYREADKLKECKTRKSDGVVLESPQRSSTVIMLGSIFSYPGAPDPTDERQKQWRDATLEFVKEYFGEFLVSVVAHVDEENYHIHAIVADHGRPVKWMIPGQCAADQALKNGKKGADVTNAFKKGYEDWQDQYFVEVCEPLGFKRKSPTPKYRMRYNKAKVQQLSRKSHELDEKIAFVDAQNAVKAAEISAREEAAELLARRAGVMSAEISAENARLELLRTEFKQSVAAAETLEKERVKLAAEMAEQQAEKAKAVAAKEEALAAKRAKIGAQATINEEEAKRLFFEKHRLIDEKSAVEHLARRNEAKLNEREAKLDEREAHLGDVEEKITAMQQTLDMFTRFIPESLRDAAKTAMDATKAAFGRIKPK